MSIQSFVVRSPITPAFIMEANFSSPATLVYVEEEGSNTPIHSRFGQGKELPPHLHQAYRSAKNSAVVNAVWGLGISYPFFEARPEETPLQVTQFTDIPQELYKIKAIQKLHGALAAKDAAPGVDPKYIPASAYLLNTCDLLYKIQERLMETPNNGASFDSGLWATTDVMRSLNDRLSNFVKSTGIIRKVGYIQVIAGSTTYDLPDDLLELNRASFHLTGATTHLLRIDKFALDNGYPGWEATTGTPGYLLEEPLEYLEILLYPKPSANGMLELIYTPTTTVAQATCDSLSIPATFEPYIAWGVVADMLSGEGEASDPERAEYAEQRYAEGIQLAMLMRGDG
jgi:hypothetical protein